MLKRKCAKCFRALADKTRIEILVSLQKTPMNVHQVQEHFHLTQPTITHHLQKLTNMGILRRAKRGREAWYSFNRSYRCNNACRVFDLSRA